MTGVAFASSDDLFAVASSAPIVSVTPSVFTNSVWLIAFPPVGMYASTPASIGGGASTL